MDVLKYKCAFMNLVVVCGTRVNMFSSEFVALFYFLSWFLLGLFWR